MKRYTDTDKWEGRFFSALSKDGKLAYNYITDRCNSIGVWAGNWDLLSFHIGGVSDLCELQKELRVGSLDDYEGRPKFLILSDNKILVVNFLSFQFPNGLKSKKPMVLGALSKAKENLKIYELLLKINGEDFFGETDLEHSKISSADISTNPFEDKKEKKADLERPVVAPKKETALQRGRKILEEKFSDIIDYANVEIAFKEYLERRRSMRCPMTARGVQTLLNKLDGLGVERWVKELNRATDESWKSVYPENTKSNYRVIQDSGETFEENSSSSLEIKV